MSQTAFALFARKARGASLIELGLVMVLVSLALAPVVRMVGGSHGASDEGNGARVIGLKSKEAILANTMVEKVLSNDYSGFDCDSSGSPRTFSPATDLPTGSSSRTYGMCRSQASNNELYYQWTVLPLTEANNGSDMPAKNRYYQATFNVLGPDKNPKTPLLTMPTNFFYNEGGIASKTESVGLMLAMDRSGSMAWGQAPYFPDQVRGFTAPFMYYRFKPFPAAGAGWGNFPANPTGQIVLDKTDNSQLDLVFGKQIRSVGPGHLKDGEDPDSDTPYNETYPFAKVNPSLPAHAIWGDGVLGTGDCSSNSANQWTNAASGDKNLFYSFIPDARNSAYLRDNFVIPICSEKASDAAWSNTINTRLSRFEAARTAALSLLLKMEEQPNVTRTIEMGFIPWGSYAANAYKVDLEKATSVNGSLRFVNMRDRLLWINRADPDDRNSALPIRMEGGTDIYRGLEFARQELMAKPYDRRIIVLLTDGEPSPNSGINSNRAYGGNGLRDYVRNNFGTYAAKENQITLFSVGLIAADANLMRDMSNSTPEGQAFIARDIASLTPIFESISYQIQKLALLSTAERYGISF